MHIYGARSHNNNEVKDRNFLIDTIQTTLLNIKLPHVDEYIDSKRRNVKMYLLYLRNIDSFVV